MQPDEVSRIIERLPLTDEHRKEALHAALSAKLYADHGPITVNALSLNPEALTPDRIVPYAHGNIKKGYQFSNVITEAFLTILFIYRYRGIHPNRFHHLMKRMLVSHIRSKQGHRNSVRSDLEKMFDTCLPEIIRHAAHYTIETSQFYF